LSIYATVNKTFVDGKSFLMQKQAEKDEMVKNEKTELFKKCFSLMKKGNTQSVKTEQKKLYHCDTLEEDFHQH
jgi:hypothetical protein